MNFCYVPQQEHQDLVGEKDERGKALSANVETSASKLSQFPSYRLDIDQMAYIAGWQAHHHHQLVYNLLKTTLFFIIIYVIYIPLDFSYV